MSMRFGGLVGIGAALVLGTCAAGTAGATWTTAGNKRAAHRDAAALVGRLVLPSGAVSLTSEPAGDGGVLRVPSSRPGATALVDVPEFWRVPERLDAVLAFVRAHPPSGGKLSETGGLGGPGIPPNGSLAFSFPEVTGRILTRVLNVTAVALPSGATGVRVDAQEVWIVTRRASERVPAGVHEIDIQRAQPGGKTTLALRVRNVDQVRRIVGWIDGLEIAQPIGCIGSAIGEGLATLTFSFRSAGGALLARAEMLDLKGRTGVCNTFSFDVRGRPQRPLMAGSFLQDVRRLLGVRL